MDKNNLNSTELEFVVFCIENLAKELDVNAETVYRILKESNIIEDYIVPGYEILHSQSKEYIVNVIMKWIEKEYK